MKKQTPKYQPIRTRVELENAMTDYAEKSALLRGVTAELDVAIANLREQYQARITAAQDALAPFAEAIEEWAALNPGEFHPKKSIELLSGRIGYRTSPPAVALLAGVKEETAITRLLEGELGGAYTRETVELDREAILAAYAAKEVTDAQLKAHGLHIKQTERFFIEPEETAAAV